MGEAWSLGESAIFRGGSHIQSDIHKLHCTFRSGADSTLRLWDVAQRACLSTTQTGSQVWAVDWQPIQADQTRVGKDFVWGGEEARVNWMRSAGSGN